MLTSWWWPLDFKFNGLVDLELDIVGAFAFALALGGVVGCEWILARWKQVQWIEVTAAPLRALVDESPKLLGVLWCPFRWCTGGNLDEALKALLTEDGVTLQGAVGDRSDLLLSPQSIQLGELVFEEVVDNLLSFGWVGDWDAHFLDARGRSYCRDADADDGVELRQQ